MGNILVVDDERGIRITLKAFLEEAGHRVETAAESQSAMALLQREPFDVVLSDIILPGISGVDLLRQIREFSPRTQVIMMTGEPTLETASESLRHGAADYLQKPVGKNDILKTVRNALKVKNLSDEKLRLEEENQNYLKRLEELVEKRTQALSVAYKQLEAEIFERRRIEDDLRKESAFREAIIVNAAEGLCVWHPIKEYPYVRFSVWNRSMEAITGYGMEEANRKDWADILCEDLAMQMHVMGSMGRSREEQVFSRKERSIRRADGEKRIVVISSSLIQTGGEPDHVIVVTQDVTDLKKAERALQKSEAQFRGLVENLHVGILIEQDDRVVYQNPEQERILYGRLSAPYQLQLLKEMVHSDEQHLLMKLRERPAAADPALLEVDLRLVSHGDAETGRTRWVSCRSRSIEYRGTDATLITMLDITELRNMEHQVLLREKMASLGHVAAGIAHEIRNPLSGINVYLDAIRENFQDPESTRDILELIREAEATSNKIERVIKRVVDFSRPTELRMQPTSLNEAIQEAVNLTAANLRKESIDLVLVLEKTLPLVYADMQLIEQVMLNLITNAARILNNLHGKREIRISTCSQQRDVLIRVEDSGPGIRPEMRDKVFEPFFTTGSHGMGIGLGICKRIISDHRGEITISSSPLGGARFDIRIPIEKRSGSR